MGLRIIGGELKRKKLYSVRGKTIRPTADRTRESIFNILSHRIFGTDVLDLFAGTGALGIEALSRGAESAVFVDNSRRSLSVVQRNVESCTLNDRANIIKWNIEKNLNCLKSMGTGFGLVFIDPPYNRNLVKPTLFNLDQSKSLQNGSCIVVEHASLEPVPTDLLAFELSDQRQYGKTLVSFLNYVI
jgi:16S rRNA (guanine966-N2)-methyltransferase